jgi:hypothetical protein
VAKEILPVLFTALVGLAVFLMQRGRSFNI